MAMTKKVQPDPRAQDNQAAIIENIQAGLSQFQELLGQLARGTEDHGDAARAAVAQVANDAQVTIPVTPTVREPTLRERLEAALRTESLDIEKLARVLKTTPGKVAEILRPLKKVGQVANVGTEDHPIWTWRLGDQCTTAELIAWVRRMIAERPMTTRELADASGAKFTRVGGAVVAIQRAPGEGNKILDLDPLRHTKRWFLVTAQMRDARLQPKRRK